MDNNNEETLSDEDFKKTVLQQKMEVAKNQVEILKTLYESITDDHFDTGVNFDKFKPSILRDFAIYTTGFMVIQNNENVINSLSDNDIISMTSGKFIIKPVNNSDIKELSKAVGITVKKGNIPTYIELHKIQDGTYSIQKKQKINDTLSPAIVLKTDGIKIYSDSDQLKVSYAQAMKTLRNLLVHEVPYLNGRKLYLKGTDFDIEVSKMWLRGYSEMFIRNVLNIDASKIKQILQSEYLEKQTPFKTKSDIDGALSKIKDCFPEDIQQNYFRVNNFVKYRLDCFSNFYNMPIETQIEIIAEICSKNENYIKSNSETISPTIVYNLQQLVSKSLKKREVFASDDEDDELFDEFFKRKEKLDEHIKKIEKFKKESTLTGSKLVSKAKELQFGYNYLLGQLKAQHAKIEQRTTVENAYMEFFDPEGIKHLPVEVAVNIVCLLGYSNLVTSGLYEEISANVNYFKPTPTQCKYFNKFNMDGIVLTKDKYRVDGNFTPAEKCTILTYLRNSIVHGNIRFTLPAKKKDKDITFRDTILTFYSDLYDMEITAKLKDFYKLFCNPAFSNENARKAIYSNGEPENNNKTDLQGYQITNE